MGNFINKYCLQLGPAKYVILVGDTSAGKTTFLYSAKLRPGWDVNPASPSPTLGFNYEEVNMESATFGVWDTSGDESLFRLTQELYKNLEIFAVIYVIRLDNDPMVYLRAKRKLKLLAGDPSLRQSAFAVVVNQVASDLRQFAEPDYLKKVLDFDNLDVDNKELFVINVKSSESENRNPVWTWIGGLAI
jgi:GTPase SAR1 family protein